jgi:hypothetical protein
MSIPTVTNIYQERAQLTLYLHAALQTFNCCRCGTEKTSKLAAVIEDTCI